MIAGIQRAGVAATAKHFPGHGDTASDSHIALPVIPHAMSRLRQIELPPFRAAVKAGARMIMTAHVALPKVLGRSDLPATLSPEIVRGLLRKTLGYDGVIVTDAMDMKALDQGEGLSIESLAAIAAGADLVLFHHDLGKIEPAFHLILRALERGLLQEAEIRRSAARIFAIKKWLSGKKQPDLEVVGSRRHLDLAHEVAAASMTLVRDRAGLLPLKLPPTASVAAVIPRPRDLTISDTSSYVTPALAAAARRYHPRVVEFLVPMNPSPSEVGELRKTLGHYDLVLMGTISAIDQPGQAALVNALLADGVRTVVIALRLPYDIAAFPTAPTCACTYSILPPSMEALAAALWGHAPFPGKLPVTLPR
jgi:beta-N-acetylhexosaminidase